MSNFAVTIMRLLLLGLAVATFAFADSGPPRAAPGSNPVASCSASSCHGDVAATWSASDPHAKAYSVLFNEDSTRIVRNLNLKRPASEEPSCLACHATSHEHASDGVGCDSCHGESRQWLSKHYEPGWQFADRSALGFVDTKDLVTRTLMCAECHVGGPGKNMNHDMIAAGHPRLAWDYSRFHYQDGYKKHWIERQPERDFEIRSWFIGQIAGLRAAAQLHLERQKSGPFLELSEASCYACHANLTPVAKRQPGVTPPWQPWHVALAKVLATATPEVFPGTGMPKLANLQSNEAKGLVADLDAWLAMLRKSANTTIPTPVVRNLAKALATAASEAAPDYDTLAPYYLAMAALHHADEKELANLKAPLEQLKAILKYKDGSPKNFDGGEAKKIFAQMQ